MTEILRDSFVDPDSTLLAAHIADTGQSWITDSSGSPAPIRILSNKAGISGSGTIVTRIHKVPVALNPANDISWSFIVKAVLSDADCQGNIAAYLNINSVVANTDPTRFYGLVVLVSINRNSSVPSALILMAFDNGVSVPIDIITSWIPADYNAEHLFELLLTSAGVLTLRIDSILIGTYSSVTLISGTPHFGLVLSRDTATYQELSVDTIVVNGVTLGVPSIIARPSIIRLGRSDCIILNITVNGNAGLAGSVSFGSLPTGITCTPASRSWVAGGAIHTESFVICAEDDAPLGNQTLTAIITEDGVDVKHYGIGVQITAYNNPTIPNDPSYNPDPNPISPTFTDESCS